MFTLHLPSVFFFFSLALLQASQLGVYRAFVDNYELAVETAEKCCQANTQFAEISEVSVGRGKNKEGIVMCVSD